MLQCACVYVCICVEIRCNRICRYTLMGIHTYINTYICIHTYTYQQSKSARDYIHTCMHACMHTYIYIHIYRQSRNACDNRICRYTLIGIHTYINTYICIHTYTYQQSKSARDYIHTYMHAYIHIHTHIPTIKKRL